MGTRRRTQPWSNETNGKYPLTEPNEGDITSALAEARAVTGIETGRAIGIVDKNDYKDKGLNENSKIHVLWINSRSTVSCASINNYRSNEATESHQGQGPPPMELHHPARLIPELILARALRNLKIKRDSVKLDQIVSYIRLLEI